MEERYQEVLPTGEEKIIFEREFVRKCEQYQEWYQKINPKVPGVPTTAEPVVARADNPEPIQELHKPPENLTTDQIKPEQYLKPNATNALGLETCLGNENNSPIRQSLTKPP